MRRLFTLLLCCIPLWMTAQITSFPYFENFENGRGGWNSTSILGSPNSWQWALPGKPTINSAASGVKAWVTDSSLAYPNNEQSSVASPVFNFTNVAQPIFRAKIWWNCESFWDGVCLQSSVDGGLTWQLVGAFGDPNNWYNEDDIVAAPGQTPRPAPGWSGRLGTGSPGWVTAEHRLNGLGGQSNVRLRFAFGTDGSVVDDGFAFDDVNIFDAPPRSVALLSFNAPLTGCGLSATEPVVVSYVNTGSQAFDSLRLSFRINNGAAILEYDTTTVNPGDTITYVFTATGNFAITGNYDVDAWVNLPGDTDLFNDSLMNRFVRHKAPVTSYPYVQNFDGPGWVPDNASFNPGAPVIVLADDWENDQLDNPNSPQQQDWVVRSVQAPIFGSGPPADHTSGTGNYLFVSDWFGYENDSVILVTPCFNLAGLLSPEMSFWYWSNETGGGFFPADVNELHVDLNDGFGWIPDIVRPAISHDTAAWKQIKVDLSALGLTGVVSFRFRINNRNNDAFSHEIAIDDFVLTDILPNDLGVSALIAPNDGCGLTATETLSIRVENFGTQAQDTLRIGYKINNGTPVLQTVIQNLASKQSTVLNFSTTANLSTPGIYTIKTFTWGLNGDTNLGNDSTIRQVEHLPTITTFPYFQNFENGGGGWKAGGPNSSWELDEPQGPVINSAASGVNSWVTNRLGTFNANEQSYVVSPCFDFSLMNLPVVKMKIWWDSQFDWEGTVFQYSLDGGLTWQNVGSFGAPDNWFNSQDITNLGWTNPTVGSNEGWSGDQFGFPAPNGSGGWVTARHYMRGIAGLSGVRFRFAFGSSQFPFGDGFAFDDIEFFEAPPVDVKSLAVLSPVSSCGLTSAPVTVRYTNQGTATLDTVYWAYQLNGGPIVRSQHIFTLNSGDTTNFSFPTPAAFPTTGYYTLRVWSEQPGEGDASNDTLTVVINSVPTISTFPYFENFEGDAGGWEAVNNNPATPMSWQWALPSGTVINTAFSGVKAWCTDSAAATFYSNNEQASVVSPCFDMTALVRPNLRMKAWWDSEFSWDGANVEYSTNNGQSWQTIGAFGGPAANNWYNDNSINGLGWSSSQNGWSGNPFNQGSNGWVTAYQPIHMLAGLSSVRIRVNFGADGSVNAFDGFAFDDFEIYDDLPNNLGAGRIISPRNGACGDSSTVVDLEIENLGVLPQSNFPVVVRIDTGGVLFQLFNLTYSGTLAPNAKDTLRMGIINTYNGANLQVTAYTNLANDQDRSGDTIRTTLNIRGIPTPPTVNGGSSCVPASFKLSVNASGRNHAWYDNPAGQPIAYGDTLQTPFLTSSTTYYAGVFAQAGDSLITTIAGGNGQNGNMFDLVNLSPAPLTVDSFYQHFTSTGLLIYEVYYVTAGGSYNGNENNANVWTFAGGGTVNSNGPNQWTKLAVNPGAIVVPVGATLGIYVTVISGTVAYTTLSAPQAYQDNNLRIETGIGKAYPFGATFTPRAWNGIVWYSAGGCSSTLVPVQAQILPPASVNLGPDRIECAGALLNPSAPGAQRYRWSTGASTPTITVSQTGAYWLQVTNAAGCTGTDTINIVVQPSPTVNLGPDLTVCTRAVLNAGNPGASYLWNLGTTNQQVTVTQSGRYWVRVTNLQGCSSSDTINVAIIPGPPVDLGPDVTTCGAAQLNATSANAVGYRWSTGSTMPQITVTQSGIYAVTVTGSNGCEANDDVVVTILPGPNINLGANRSVCDSVILDAGNPGATYVWSTLATTRTLKVKTTGTYTVEVQDLNGCTNSASVNLTVEQSPKPAYSYLFTSATQAQFSNFSTPVGAGVTYTWDFGDGVGSSTLETPVYTYQFPGNYVVKLTVCTPNCGCKSTERLIGTAIEDPAFLQGISIFPNPNRGQFNLVVEDLRAGELDLRITDVNGREIYRYAARQPGGVFSRAFDLSKEANGVYMLRITDGERIAFKRVVKE